jgi:hypothetical protein
MAKILKLIQYRSKITPGDVKVFRYHQFLQSRKIKMDLSIDKANISQFFLLYPLNLSTDKVCNAQKKFVYLIPINRKIGREVTFINLFVYFKM